MDRFVKICLVESTLSTKNTIIMCHNNETDLVRNEHLASTLLKLVPNETELSILPRAEPELTILPVLRFKSQHFYTTKKKCTHKQIISIR